jgi:hypothetical protein
VVFVALVLFGCRNGESGAAAWTTLPRQSLVRLGEEQRYERCAWPGGEDAIALRDVECEGEAERASALGTDREVARAIVAARDDGSRVRLRLIAATDEGGVVEAIRELRRVRAAQSATADLDGELAAAFLRLAEIGDDAYSLFFALETLLASAGQSTEDSVQRFNRAVAWELLGVSDEAAAEWGRYLAAERGDGRSPWAAEARQRLAHLERELRSRGNTAQPEWTPARLAEGRERLIETLLLEWAEAEIAGTATADGPLREAEAIANATGDELASQTLAQVRAAGAHAPRRRALAEAHRLLAVGIASRRRFELESAVSSLSASRDRLASLGSPAALLAEYHIAMSIYHLDDYPEAAERLAAVSVAADARGDGLIAGLARKSAGTIAQVTGRPDIARASYRQALEDVRRSGDRRERLNVEVAVADGLLAVGDDRDAWRAMRTALHGAWRHPDDRIRYVVAAYAASMAEKRGFVHLATAMTGLSLEAIRDDGSPAAIADSATWYAASLLAKGDVGKAAEVLRGIRPLLAAIADPEVARRAVADLDCAEGRQLLSAGMPAAAMPRLRSGADYYSGLQQPLLTLAAPCRAAEGQALLDLGETDQAVAVLEESLAMASQLDGFLPRPDSLYGSTDPTVALLESVLTLELERQRPWEALRLAGLALRRATPGARGASGPQADASAPSAALVAMAAGLDEMGRVVLVVYALPHGVVTWRLGGGSIAVHRSEVALGELLAISDRFVAGLRHGYAVTAAPESSRLHGLLLGDLLDGAPADRDLVIVATPELAGLPWAFLDAPGGAPLLAHWAVASAPNLEVAMASARTPAAPSPDRREDHSAASPRMLVVANPAVPGDYQFPPLPRAEEEAALIATLFDTPMLLVGERATKTDVIAGIPRAVSVHLAVHGIADARAPGASYLLLRGASGEREPLTAEELLRLDLGWNQLVVLAACESSLRSSTLAASTFGLAEAFLAAGARSVVASGWAVDDAETSRFMGDFYRALAEGETVGQALRKAQLVAMAASGKGEPRGVAAFRLQGDPSVTLRILEKRGQS